MMRHSKLPVITTDRLLLRPLTMTDARPLYQAIDFSRLHFSTWFAWARTASSHSVTENIRRSEDMMALGTAWHYVIVAPGNEVIGRISLDDISTYNKSAELGYWLRQDYEGQGLMTEAALGIVNTAFQTDRFHRIFAAVDTENIGSQRVVERVGFRREGTLRHVVCHPDRGWRSHHIYAQLWDEWARMGK